MRRAVLLAVLIAVGVAGVAYAATVQNKYVVKASVKPVKAGTVPVSLHLEYKTSTVPAGQRPNVIKTIKYTFAGIRSHANSFKGCGSSRINDPSEGPSTCPAQSKIGTGTFTALIGPSGNQSTSAPPCQAEITVYNGGGDTLTLYVYVTQGQGQCPLSQPVAFAAKLKQTSKALSETVTIPESLRHALGFDIASTDVVINIPVKTTKVHKKKVALLESFACPASKQRSVQVKFTQENGAASLSTRNVACK